MVWCDVVGMGVICLPAIVDCTTRMRLCGRCVIGVNA